MKGVRDARTLDPLGLNRGCRLTSTLHLRSISTAHADQMSGCTKMDAWKEGRKNDETNGVSGC